MSAKKIQPWKTLLLSLLLTAALYGGGVLLIALLMVRGTLGEERTVPALAVLALLSALVGGSVAGRGRLGPGAGLLNAVLFCVLLAGIGLAVWEELTSRGLFLLGAFLVGGALSALIGRKVGKQNGKRLVRSHKKARST